LPIAGNQIDMTKSHSCLSELVLPELTSYPSARVLRR
jgi:hypothetical protein